MREVVENSVGGAEQTKLFLADDQLSFFAVLSLWLEQAPDFVIIGNTNRAHNLLEQLHATQADILLLDWDLADLHTEQAKAQLIRALRQQFPWLRIIALSSAPGVRQHVLAMGAHAFVSKTESPDHLLAALEMNRGRH